MYISIDSLIPVFSHWAILHFNTIIYFDALFVPRLASEGPFKQASGSLAHVPFFLKLFFLFLSPSFPLFVPPSLPKTQPPPSLATPQLSPKPNLHFPLFPSPMASSNLNPSPSWLLPPLPKTQPLPPWPPSP